MTTSELRRAACELTASSNVETARLKEIVLRLQERGGTESNSAAGREYEVEAAKTCLKLREELPEAELENPLDDDEKLRQVRIEVFGCAPE